MFSEIDVIKQCKITIFFLRCPKDILNITLHFFVCGLEVYMNLIITLIIAKLLWFLKMLLKYMLI